MNPRFSDGHTFLSFISPVHSVGGLYIDFDGHCAILHLCGLSSYNWHVIVEVVKQGTFQGKYRDVYKSWEMACDEGV